MYFCLEVDWYSNNLEFLIFSYFRWIFFFLFKKIFVTLPFVNFKCSLLVFILGDGFIRNLHQKIMTNREQIIIYEQNNVMKRRSNFLNNRLVCAAAAHVMNNRIHLSYRYFTRRSNLIFFLHSLLKELSS